MEKHGSSHDALLPQHTLRFIFFHIFLELFAHSSFFAVPYLVYAASSLSFTNLPPLYTRQNLSASTKAVMYTF